MRRPADVPLPGLGGAVRFGRTAAAAARRTIPAWSRGRGPLAWCVEVDPADVIVHLWCPGELQPKERPVVPRKVKQRKDGTVYIPPAFTPTKTREAEQVWRQIFALTRLSAAPWDGEVGMRVIVLTARLGGHQADWDNLGKLLSDAANGVLYVDDVQVVEPSLSVRRGRPKGAAGVDVLFWRIRPGHRLGGYSSPPVSDEGG